MLKKFLLSLASGCFVFQATPTFSQVVYHETFDSYGFKPPMFSDAGLMGEFPPSLKFVQYRPTKGGNPMSHQEFLNLVDLAQSRSRIARTAGEGARPL